uniref:Uncharacterized protein n=1 Tax=Cacopsylla melanoneura TaxID=428564 RepID=A0A8D8XDT5_9HEMI
MYNYVTEYLSRDLNWWVITFNKSPVTMALFLKTASQLSLPKFALLRCCQLKSSKILHIRLEKMLADLSGQHCKSAYHTGLARGGPGFDSRRSHKICHRGWI